MIQFNLLPDIKIDFIKAQRTRRLVMLISVIACCGSIALLIFISLIVFVAQKAAINGLDKKIKTNVAQIQKDSAGNIEKILSIQGQLQTLPGLHEQKPIASRLFEYMTKITPASATISKIEVDFTQNTMEIGGAADKLSTINQFVDTLKFTKYSVSGSDEQKEAFPASSVILSGYGRDEKGATYRITLSFDPAIFNGNTGEINLNVPNLITTRSSTERPLFKLSEPAPDIKAQTKTQGAQ